MCWRQFSGDFEPDFLVKMSKLKFGQNSKSEFWPRFCRWSFADILMLILVRSMFWGRSFIKILKQMFGSDAKFWCYLKAFRYLIHKGYPPSPSPPLPPLPGGYLRSFWLRIQKCHWNKHFCYQGEKYTCQIESGQNCKTAWRWGSNIS